MEEEQLEDPNGTDESPRNRFERLASLRTNEVLKRLKILGNCSNKRIYEYGQTDVYKMFDEIERRVRETKAKFLDAQEQGFRI